MRRKFGWIRVSGKFIDPENQCLRLMMAKVVVIDVRRHYDRDAVDYLVYCDDMDLIPEGCIAPRYQAIFTGDPIQIEFRRISGSERGVQE